MVRKIFFAITLLLLTTSSVLARPLTLNEIQQAVCRVTAQEGFGQKAMGTGTCVGESDTHYYILTNAHVVGKASSVGLEFFRGGYKTRSIPAAVVWRAYQERTTYDFAVCQVEKAHFGTYPPRIISLAPQGYQPKPGYYIAAMGCPSGRWAQGWEGHIEADEGNKVIFVPQPVGGQSGSGLVVVIPDAKGELHSRIGAVLTWRTQNNTGAAIPINNLYSALSGNQQQQKVSYTYQEIARRTYFLGSDNRVYIGVEDDFGGLHVTYPQGVTTQRHLGQKNPYDSAGGCLPGSGCPSPFNRQPQPRPQPRPQPQPGWGPSPGPRPTPGTNPYGGVNPPDITAPWPGADKPTPEVAPVEPVKPVKPEPVKPTPEVTKPTTDDTKPTPDTNQDKEVKLGIFGGIQSKVDNFTGGVLTGVGIGFLGLFWHRVLRKKLIVGVDSFQDVIQKKVTKKWGSNAGRQARELMEGAEESMLGFCDDFFEQEKSRNKVEKTKLRGELANRVNNGSGPRINGSALDAFNTLESLADDPDVKEVSPETVAKVKEALTKKT